MNILDNFRNLFNRDSDNLVKTAEALETLSAFLENAVEIAHTAYLGVDEYLDAFNTWVDTATVQWRQAATDLRTEAEAKSESVFTDLMNKAFNVQSTKTRDEKVEHIIKCFNELGIKDTKWSKATVHAIPDSVVDATYAAFGGK